MIGRLTILLVLVTTLATAQMKQYQCGSYSIRGELIRDTVNISIIDSTVYIMLPGHDHKTLHTYMLRVQKKTRNGGDLIYSLTFSSARRPAILLVNEYHIYFRHDREEYLYYITRWQE